MAQSTQKKGGEEMTESKDRRERGEGSYFLRGKTYWIKYYRNGKPYRESAKSYKESDARSLLKKRLGEIVLGRFIGPDAERVTIRQLAKDYENDYRINGKKSLDKAERVLNHVLECFGDYKAHQVHTDKVNAYISLRQEEGAANATINRELAALKRMYNLGIRAEKIYRKPYIPMLQENNVRRGFFEHGDFVALRTALPDYFKPVVTFAYYTGWRKQEILSLRWNQVDLPAQTIRLDPGTTKSGAGRTVALDGELLAVIKGQWEMRKVAEIPGQSPTLLCTFVFHRDGKPVGDFRDVWAKACKEARLPGKVLHDFRRTAVRNMVRAGVPERVAMMVSGHKTRSVFDRYNIVSEEDLKEAARRTWAYAQAQDSASKVVSINSDGRS